MNKMIRAVVRLPLLPVVLVFLHGVWMLMAMLGGKPPSYFGAVWGVSFEFLTADLRAA
jgi:hypothetical protein